MADAIRMAIAALLEADAELTTLATGGVHWRRAPEGTDHPLVIFSRSSGTFVWTFEGPPMRPQRYLVKGVGFADDAEDIDKRCRELLTDASLNLPNENLLLKPLPRDDVSYGEEKDGEAFDHVGTEYEVTTEEQS